MIRIRPCRSSRIKGTWLAPDSRNTPPIEILIEAGGTVENVVHVQHIASFPITDVLIEAGGISEHVLHVRHTTGIPTTDVLRVLESRLTALN